MADQADIDATLERYYRAWATRDHDLYRTVWSEDASFADPPADGELPPTGFEEILAGMEQVWSRMVALEYHRSHTWHCGHSVAVQSTVRMTFEDGAIGELPMVHVFRFNGVGLVRRLEAFLDSTLLEMVQGNRPAWLNPTSS